MGGFAEIFWIQPRTVCHWRIQNPISRSVCCQHSSALCLRHGCAEQVHH